MTNYKFNLQHLVPAFCIWQCWKLGATDIFLLVPDIYCGLIEFYLLFWFTMPWPDPFILMHLLDSQFLLVLLSAKLTLFSKTFHHVIFPNSNTLPKSVCWQPSSLLVHTNLLSSGPMVPLLNVPFLLFLPSEPHWYTTVTSLCYCVYWFLFTINDVSHFSSNKLDWSSQYPHIIPNITTQLLTIYSD